MKLRKIKDRELRQAFRRIRRSERDGSFMKYVETEQGAKDAIQILWRYHNKSVSIGKVFPVLAKEMSKCSLITEV